jgi:hypothetical protein
MWAPHWAVANPSRQRCSRPGDTLDGSFATCRRGYHRWWGLAGTPDGGSDGGSWQRHENGREFESRMGEDR